MVNLTKHQWKICESVHLKMDYYYMGPKDKRYLTEKERKEAELLLPVLPNGWFTEEQDWMAMVKAESRYKTRSKRQ